MNAHPNEQRILLRLQELDTRAVQLTRHAQLLPQLAAIADIDALDANSARERLDAHTVLEAARAELGRIASDVQVVEARIVRDTALESSNASAKDVAAIEHELASLRERLSRLEDAELELMERVEDAEAVVGAIEARIADRAGERAALVAERDSALGALERERQDASADRRALAATVDPALLDTFEHRQARLGNGAGLLRQKSCGACSMQLTGADLERIRQTSPDVVTFCPECDAVLVRTEESGL